MTFKKYILFQYDNYYPRGGIRDIADSFDTLEEALKFIQDSEYQRNVVVNHDTWEVIWKT